MFREHEVMMDILSENRKKDYSKSVNRALNARRKKDFCKASVTS
jgi:hypothetical protein